MSEQPEGEYHRFDGLAGNASLNAEYVSGEWFARDIDGEARIEVGSQADEVSLCVSLDNGEMNAGALANLPPEQASELLTLLEHHVERAERESE